MGSRSDAEVRAGRSRRVQRPLASIGRRVRTSIAELRRSSRIILQASVAAGLAYALAQSIGHAEPFFAPIAAVATVAVSLAHRIRRAFELILANAVGILFAGLLIGWIGTGAWQLAVVVAVAFAIALVLGGGPILIMQSSTAAIAIATITPPTAQHPFNVERVVDALIGGAVGLAVAALLLPVDPARHAGDATEPLLASISRGLRDVASALRRQDRQIAESALTRLRSTGPVIADFQAGLDATRESVRLVPWYWRQGAILATYALAAAHLDNALRNLRVLARQATAALDGAEPVPEGLPEALDLLASATLEVAPTLAGKSDTGVALEQIVLAVNQVTGHAAEPARPSPDPSDVFARPMVAQVRLIASDLLQACGMSAADAVLAIRAAADWDPAR